MTQPGALYLDTNVIVARYKPADPLYQDVNELFSGGFGFFISPITLFELYSVISRIRPNLVLPQEARHASIATIVRFMIEDCGLKPAFKTLLASSYLLGERVRSPLEYWLTMMLAEKLRLRVLDLLHIAYAAMLRDKVKVFVTGDDEILEQADAIEKAVELKVKHPKELL